MNLTDQKGPNCFKATQAACPKISQLHNSKAAGFKPSTTKTEPSGMAANASNPDALLYEKRYKCSETTGRPNQVFVCLVCHAQRPKLSKILKHLNVHKRNKQTSTSHATR